jgi:uncharacterized membrane protein YeaQ/YmgE (transglycosylase-associated protein family)
MGILTWIVLGLIAGILGKLLLPGKDPGGWIITILLGIGGAFFGAWVGSFFGIGSISGVNLTSICTATGGAILLLLIFRMIKR